MSSESHPSKDWEVIAAALLAAREAQRRTWGQMDDLTVANYLAGACTADERKVVEQWIRDFPAVRDLVEVVRASFPAEAGAAAAAKATAVRVWTESRQAVRRLSEDIAAWIDKAGQGVSAGLAGCQLAPQLALAGRTLDAASPAAMSWQIPLEPLPAQLTIVLRPAAVRGPWQLVIHSEGLSPNASLEVSLAGREPDLSDRLSAWEGRAVTLEPGEWTLAVADHGDTWEVPLKVGVPPA
jgi:hypothetical protein